jgi:hypothetical protein
MLKLPDSWQTSCGGSIASQLLTTLEPESLKHECARQLIGATLELSWTLRPNPRRLKLETCPDFCWHVEDLIYIYLPVIDDRSLSRYLGLQLDPRLHILIVPDSHWEVFRLTLRAALGKQGVPPVAFDSFISLRVGFASIDARWSRLRTLEELFNRYNRRVIDENSDVSLLIDYSTLDGSGS